MNIFVVEDEHWALKEMEALLKEYEPEHKIYAFENGEDAFEHVKKVKPDLIITDITMPRMNGLELIEKITEIDRSIKTIILTVHDTFNYAKTGIQLGVMDYLLKPVKKQALFEVTDKAIADIEKDQKLKREKEKWTINQLLFSSMEEASESAEINQKEYVFLYLLIGNWQTNTEKDHFLSELNLKNIMHKLGLPLDHFWVVHIDSRRKVMLLPKNDHLNIEHEFLPKLYEYLCAEGQVHMCYLNKEPQIELKDAFESAHKALTREKLFGKSTFINAKKESTPDKDLRSIWDIVRFLELSIEKGESARIKSYIEQLIQQLRKIVPTQKQLQDFIVDMNYAILFKLRQKKTMALEIDPINQNIDHLNHMVTFSELEKWLHTYFYQLAETFSPKDVAPKHLIPKVKRWVEQDYAKNITFLEFSDAHHVSLSYLSREFKAQTGMTFVEYLTEVRIKKAIELFEAGKERTVEVGELVGYHDPKHFRTVFKKVTNYTPKEYKQKRVKWKE
ncbi:response regulator transcription factor [Saliterribacillus persicus]|uniref:YesN/AraC family two-component response regulator n=1 Tax=Saliterribacillus persicus TaxID=930114 RepID=A0A368XYZ2_9BACI|nr:response regulator [Saliterribacillus persicus]RCW73192.1 YesN/AraC family two-component response regulator [Saliterribacillus persicus]